MSIKTKEDCLLSYQDCILTLRNKSKELRSSKSLYFHWQSKHRECCDFIERLSDIDKSWLEENLRSWTKLNGISEEEIKEESF